MKHFYKSIVYFFVIIVLFSACTVAEETTSSNHVDIIFIPYDPETLSFPVPPILDMQYLQE